MSRTVNLRSSITIRTMNRILKALEKRRQEVCATAYGSDLYGPGMHEASILVGRLKKSYKETCHGD